MWKNKSNQINRSTLSKTSLFCFIYLVFLPFVMSQKKKKAFTLSNLVLKNYGYTMIVCNGCSMIEVKPLETV